MNPKHEPTTSSDLGGAPGGLGAPTGADPRGPAAGMKHPRAGEDRSFASSEPGRTSEVGEGGGAMSGRGQEHGPDQAHQGREAREQALRDRPDGGIGGGGVAGAGTGGGGLGHDSELGAPSGGLGGDAGLGEGSSGGGQITGAMDGGGDAHLGKDGTRLGDPMNARRQVRSDDSRDIANGSGAD
jgi:hypothetical protein